MNATPSQCPVCRARFRAQRHCPRCGADLGPLMSLAARAFVLRRQSRQALRDGDLARADALVREAQRLRDTPAGRRLGFLLPWLRSQPRSAGGVTDGAGRPGKSSAV